MNNIFNINNVLNEKNNVVNSVFDVKYDNLFINNETNVTFGNLALNHIMETKAEYNRLNKELYKSILESQHVDVMHESFAEFMSNVKDIISKFFKFLKNLAERFMLSLASMYKSDSFINKNKGNLKYFNTDTEFTYLGYNYTIVRHVPALNVLYDEVNRDVEAINFVYANTQSISRSNLDILINKNNQLSDNLSEWYDTFRARVLGKGGTETIYQEDFSSELFEIFRDDTADKTNIVVTRNQVDDSLRFFEKYNEIKSQVEKDRSRIEKEYKSLEKELDKISMKVKMSGSGNPNASTYSNYEISHRDQTGATNTSNRYMNNDDFSMANSFANIYNTFMKCKVNQVVECSAIHSLAFSYKLDALRDCYTQDKEILYKALGAVSKNKDYIYREKY